jgi:hypothetical protein
VKRPAGAALLLLPFAALLAVHAPLLRGGVYFTDDLTHITQPWRFLCAEALQRGMLPLWDPYAFFGLPLLGNMQAGALSPLAALFHVFPFTRALGPFLLLHYALALFWTWLWLRSRGFRGSAALAGASLFALGGYLTAYLQFPNLLATLAHLPALLLFAGRPLPFAFACADALLSGYPPVLGAGIAAVFAVSAAWPAPGSGGLRREWARTAAGAALGLALGAAVLFPGAELSRQSARVRDILPDWQRMAQSLRPYELTAFVHPAWTRRLMLAGQDRSERLETVTWDDGGAPRTFTFRSDYRDSLRDPAGLPVSTWKSVYVGFAGMALALAGLLLFAARSPGRAAAAAALLAAVALLVLGKHCGASSWLWEHCAPLWFIRGPARLGYLALAALVPLAALAVDRLARRSRAAAALCALVVIAELSSLAYGFYPALPADYYTTKGPLVERLQKELAGARYFLSTTGEVWALVDKDDRSPEYRRFRETIWRSYRQKLFGIVGASYHLAAAGGEYEPLLPAEATKVVEALRDSPKEELAARLRASGVRLYLDRREDPKSPLKPLGTTLWHVYGTPEEPVGALLVARERSPLLEGSFEDGAKTLRGAAWKRALRREDRVLAEGEAREGGTLFLSEPFYPGWEARVDGVKTERRRALGAFTSVEVPAGARRVELRYAPGSWRLGLALSLSLLTALLSGLWLRLRAF